MARALLSLCFKFAYFVAAARGRGASGSGRGGSSGGSAVGFASFQDQPDAGKKNFPKYVAGANAGYLTKLGQRPAYFSSPIHRYRKDWLVGDNEGCPDELMCCDTNCCKRQLNTVQIVAIVCFALAYVLLAAWMTKICIFGPPMSKKMAKKIREQNSTGIYTMHTRAAYANSSNINHSNDDRNAEFRQVQLRNVKDLLSVVRAPLDPEFLNVSRV